MWFFRKVLCFIKLFVAGFGMILFGFILFSLSKEVLKTIEKKPYGVKVCHYYSIDPNGKTNCISRISKVDKEEFDSPFCKSFEGFQKRKYWLDAEIDFSESILKKLKVDKNRIEPCLKKRN